MKPLVLCAALLLAPFLTPLALPAQTPGMGSMTMPAKPVAPSHSLVVTFQGHTTTFSVEDLLKLPQTKLTAHNGHTGKEEVYTGPLLADVLHQSGLTASAETHALILHSAVIATGADHYYVLYSGAEVEPMFATGKVIVALTKDGLPDTEGGILQLVNNTDSKPARWVHGLASLNVIAMEQHIP